MKKLRMITFAAMAIASAVVSGTNVLAAPYSPEMNEVQAVNEDGEGPDFQSIITRSDVQVAFLNDEQHPWTVEGGTAIIRGNGQSNYYSASWLKLSFSSTKRTELSFDWAEYNYSYHESLQVYVDGVYKGYANSSSYNSKRLYIDAGEHVVAFRDSVSYYNYTGNWSGIKNMQIKEIKPLETVLLTENSEPLTFTNDDNWAWTIEDGYVQNGNYGNANTASRFSTTFTVDKTMKFSFKRRVSRHDDNYNNENYHNLYTYLDGVSVRKDWNYPEFTYYCFVVEPGTYTVEWKDTVYNRSENYFSQIKDVELSENWFTVELSTPGTLGYEVLYSGHASVLDDVEMLKVVGRLNDADWTDIMNMTNLKALDLTEAQITEVPDNAFKNKGWLNCVFLPEGITRIGDYAFQGTSIRRIAIPSTVKTIGQFAFNATPLRALTFAENSQIETIGVFAFAGCTSLQSVDFKNNATLASLGNAAFYNCTLLKEFVMPNTVTTMGYSVFQDCSSLKKLVMADPITTLKDYTCSGCSALEELKLPESLKSMHVGCFRNTSQLQTLVIPASVNEIRAYAFQSCGVDSLRLPITMQKLWRNAFNNCTNLKYVELPSYIENGEEYYYTYYYYATGTSINSYYYYDDRRFFGYYDNFSGCTAVDKIVMRAATPPVITNDPFSACVKKNVTLVVPSFSVVNYKLDTYWYQFGTIVEGDDVDYWKITSPLMLTNNRRMQGTPDIDLYYGGQLTVGGSAPFPMGQFNYYVNENNPGRLLNTCDAMTADQVAVHFAVEANKWYFFTPLYDVALADINVSNEASYVFRYYDAQNRAANGASGSWKNVTDEKLFGGQGYIFHCNTACTITFPADEAGKAKLFGTSDVTCALTVNEAANNANRSWNYVGNPYPAYYDIYYMDFSAPITVWNGSTYQAYSIADDEFVLRPMQSFFVQKPDAVDNIIFHKEGRQVTTSIAHAAAARAQQQGNRYLFNLGISSNNESDVTRVVINDNASVGYEIECDAAKFMSFETGVPQLFTADSEGNSYAINERPLGNGQVSLAYYAGQEGFYTIRALRADGEVTLYDAVLNKTVDLTLNDYTFQSEATNGTNSSRFMLTFKIGNGGTTAISELNVHEADTQAYDLQGRKTTAIQKGIYVKDGHKVVKK